MWCRLEAGCVSWDYTLGWRELLVDEHFSRACTIGLSQEAGALLEATWSAGLQS